MLPLINLKTVVVFFFIFAEYYSVNRQNFPFEEKSFPGIFALIHRPYSGVSCQNCQTPSKTHQTQSWISILLSSNYEKIFMRALIKLTKQIQCHDHQIQDTSALVTHLNLGLLGRMTE